MKLIEYNLANYAIAQQIEREAVLFDLYDDIVIRLNNVNEEYNKYVISARKYGTDILYKEELQSNEYVLPKGLITEGKIILNVESLDKDGNILQSWLLEPLQLVSISNKETKTLELIPDVTLLRELMIERLNMQDDKLIKQDENINALTRDIILLKNAVTELTNRITADEEIILNPFTK